MVLRYRVDGVCISWPTIESTIKVDKVEPLTPFGYPILSHSDGVIRINSRLVQLTLFQVNNFAILEVDSRDDLHL